MKSPTPQKAESRGLHTCKFSGTDNPRHLRVTPSLLVRTHRPEDVDDVAVCSNDADHTAALRSMVLKVPFDRIKFIDRGGCVYLPGIYSLTAKDLRLIWAWKAKRKQRSLS